LNDPLLTYYSWQLYYVTVILGLFRNTKDTSPNVTDGVEFVGKNTDAQTY